MFNKIHLSFEFKSMGWAFFVPFLPFIILGYQLFTIVHEASVIYLTFEFLIAPFGCWWLIFLYQEHFEGGLVELLPSYPLSKWQHGLLKGGIVITIYLIIMSLFILLASLFIPNATFGPMALKYISLSFLFCSVSFVFVTTVKNVIISLSIIAIYTVTEYMTRGDVIPWHHLFTFNIEPPTYKDSISNAIVHIVFGLLFFFIGHLRILKTFNFMQKSR